jgi:hypothetical protein
LKVGHGHVAVQCAVTTQKGLAQVDDTHEGRHSLRGICFLVLGCCVCSE